jgi:hypothetical protein
MKFNYFIQHLMGRIENNSEIILDLTTSYQLSQQL